MIFGIYPFFLNDQKSISQRSTMERFDMNQVSGHIRLVSSFKNLHFRIAVHGKAFWLNGISSAAVPHWEESLSSHVASPVSTSSHTSMFSLPDLETCSRHGSTVHVWDAVFRCLWW